MTPAPWFRRGSWALVALALTLGGCGARETVRGASIPPSSKTGPAIRYGYEVVRAWPHDPKAYTQGLVFRQDRLLESTGIVGASSLRDTEWQTGRILKQVTVPPPYFAEGLAVIGAKAYQLTWQHRKGFIYDADTFQSLGEFTYEGEGWGLATDGSVLVMSDGTSRLRFIDPATFKVVRTVAVTADGKPVENLNELEYIGGEIFANVWQTDRVVRIDPASGNVRGTIDFSGLLTGADRIPTAEVLNGIAYDPAADRLFITGKYWPKIFEVRLKTLP